MVNKEIIETYKKYKRAVNMTSGELITWSRTVCSRKASLDRTPIIRNTILLSKPLMDWGIREMKMANKTIAFISRMRKVRPGRIIKECGLSKRDISLMNWGYNPKKKR